MRLYVVSTKLQPVVHFQACLKSMKQVWLKNPSADELLATFNASRMDTLIACDNIEGAMVIARYLTEKGAEQDNFIPKAEFAPSIRFSATTVVYTIDVNSTTIPPPLQTFSLQLLANYADFTTIPGFKASKTPAKISNEKVQYKELPPYDRGNDYEILPRHIKTYAKEFFDDPTEHQISPEYQLMYVLRRISGHTFFWQLNNLQQKNVMEATYHNASNNKIVVNLKLNPTPSFFSSPINLFSSYWWEDKPIRYP